LDLDAVGVVSRVGSGIGVLDGVYVPQEKEEVLMVFWSIGLNGVFECIF